MSGMEGREYKASLANIKKPSESFQIYITGYYMYACSIFNDAISVTEDYIVSNEVVIGK
jgi:hypothetical protein